MVDYVKFAATAERLITTNGRSITFKRKSEVAADPDKPWGPQTGADTEFTTNSVFVPPNTVRQFGLTALGQGTEFQDLIAFSDYIGIFFPGTEDIRAFTHVQDGAELFGIIGLQILKPADVQLLGLVGIRR